MLKKFLLKNYKNFKDEICVNFEKVGGYQFSTDCITDGRISKMLIYGRNATGKTNLGNALMDIFTTTFRTPIYRGDGNILNADSSETTALFAYTFQFGESELIYQYTKTSNFELQMEELLIDNRTVYKCDFMNEIYDFDNLKIIEAETVNKDIYLQSRVNEEGADELMEHQLPFLRWLINNAAFKADSILIKLSNYVRRMTIITAGNTPMFRSKGLLDDFYESLEDSKRLQDLEDFLNAMGIECRLTLQKLPDGQRELYFAHGKLVPFYQTASSGTRALVELYRRLISKVWDSSFIYLDEFDAFYHYEMAENVIKFFKKRYPKTQMIMTSHNTNLMTNRLMRPDCLFILSREGSLTALCDATMRELREGHNLEKMYISGEFEQYE